jgi:hypothetical protein
MKKFLPQLGIFFFLLLLIETFMRGMGFREGVLRNEFYPLDSCIVQPLFRADEMGITTFDRSSPKVPIAYVLNKQGFRSPLNYNKETVDSLRLSGRKIVMLIGDSYTEGCCDLPVDSSFADLLYAKEDYAVLNFGVGATDLVQYQQIIRKYVPLLKPDLVVVAFYLGNDIATYEREAVPYIPAHYLVKDYPWLQTYLHPYRQKEEKRSYAASGEEAYHFYLDYYTLWGRETNYIESLLRRSVLLSRVYLILRELYVRLHWEITTGEIESKEALNNRILREMQAETEKVHSRFLLTPIPSPGDVSKQKDLQKVYGAYFTGIQVAYPEISHFNLQDYDGKETKNHFVHSGSRKYYYFLRAAIESMNE